MSKNRSRTVKKAKDLWDITTPEGNVIRRAGLGLLIDMSIATGYPTGDFIFQAALMTKHLRSKGYTLTYVNSGETEDLEIDGLDPVT